MSASLGEVIQSAAGPSRGRPCERGEAQARRARPRAWTAADAMPLDNSRWSKEAAARPLLEEGVREVRPAASLGEVIQ